MALSFIFGPGQDYATPQELAKARAVATAIMGNQRAPKDVGEGLNAIGQALLYRSLAGRADASEKAGQASRAATMNPVVAALGGQPAFPAAPASSNKVADALSGKPSSSGNVDLSQTKQDFVSGLMPAAMDASQRTGVDPRIIVAQAAQETGWGKHAPGNNFFGIKSHGQGGGQNLATTEYVNGKPVRVNDSFRGYASPADSVAGYADFLLKNPRYKPMMNAQGLDAQLQALGASGYATDPNYAQSVGAIARSLPMPGARPQTALSAVNAMAGNQPTQVASLDPSAGLPPAPAQPASGNMPAPQMQTQAPQASTRPPVQVAQAAPPPVDPSRLPAMAGGTADTFQASNGPSLQQLYTALQNPWLNDSDRALLGAEIQRQQQAADPLRQMQIKKLQREIETPQKNWQKLDDTHLYDPSSGEIKEVGGGGGARPGGFRFKGTSVEAQSLNGLMDGGQLTEEQAQQLGAGKTVTDPQTGAILFMTPQGVFGQSPQGGPPQPLAPQGGASRMFSPQPIGGAQAVPPQVTPQTPAQAPQTAPSGQRQGMIPITPPKPEKPMNKEQSDAATFADRMRQASAVLDNVGNAGQSIWGQAVTDNDYIPDAVEGYLTSGDFQKFAQARRNFINAVLRRESGAVIAPSEFADANKQYFPMPGDTKETLEQKRRNRESVMQGMTRAAGDRYDAAPPADTNSDTGSGAVDWRTYFGGR